MLALLDPVVCQEGLRCVGRSSVLLFGIGIELVESQWCWSMKYHGLAKHRHQKSPQAKEDGQLVGRMIPSYVQEHAFQAPRAGVSITRSTEH